MCKKKRKSVIGGRQVEELMEATAEGSWSIGWRIGAEVISGLINSSRDHQEEP